MVTAEGVTEFCRLRLAGYKCPRSVGFVDALPRNAAGKVLQHVLQAEWPLPTDTGTST